MTRTVKLLIGGFLAAAVVFGLLWSNQPYISTKNPATLTLYALDGNAFAKPDVEEEFHKYPVLGKVNIQSAKTRMEIVAAINAGVAESGAMAKCFWPRHGVSVADGKKTLDFVICFECFQVKRFDGSSDSTVATSAKREPFFDKLLTDAGVKLAAKK